MIYLNDAIESAVRTVMDFLRFKRNSGVLEINEYELQNSSDIDYCDSTEFTFDIVAIFEEKSLKKFYSRDFKYLLNSTFAVKNIQKQAIENNRVQVTITCTQIA